MGLLLPRRIGDPPLSRLTVTCWLALMPLLAPLCAGQQSGADTPAPFFQLRSQQSRYVGPADQSADTTQVDEIRIGYFGPADPEDPVAGQMWRGAQLAIEHANRAGGYQGKSFRLLSAWSNDPWGTGVKQLTQLVYQDHVWAIIGGIDGASTHLAEQVVAKARLPLISPVSTDKTVNLANVPWMFSLAPSDDRIAAALAPCIAETTESGSFVLLSANDHDSCLLARELRSELTRQRLVPAFQYEFHPGTDRMEVLVGVSLESAPKTVVVVADAAVSAQLVNTLRQQGFTGPVVGGPGFARVAFREQVGDRAGELLFPQLLEDAEVSRSAAVVSDPREPSIPLLRGPDAPLPSDWDYTALQAYDAVQMTVEAIRKAGLSRVDIGTALRELSPCRGVSGRIEFDGLGCNQRRATVTSSASVELVRPASHQTGSASGDSR